MEMSSELKDELNGLIRSLQDEYILEHDEAGYFLFDTFPDDKLSGGDYFKGIEIANRKVFLLKHLEREGFIKIKPNVSKRTGEKEERRFNVKIYSDKIKSFREKKAVSDDKTIRTIEIVPDSKSKNDFVVVVNENYLENDLIRVSRTEDVWNIFFEMIDNTSVPFKKSFYDYFNSNSNNKLYTKTKFPTQKLITKTSDNYCVPNFVSKVLTQTTFKRRQNKA